MAEVRVTSAPVIVETEGIAAQVTQLPVLVETEGVAAEVTQLLVLVEHEARELRATELFVLVEYEILAVPYYAVGDQHNVPAASLTRLDPQPRSDGVKVTRRTHSPNNNVLDEGKYIELVYLSLGSVAEYQAVLDEYGIKTALQNEITLTAKDATLGWARFNGIAVQPQLGVDAHWREYFPRDIVVLVKELEVSS